MENKNNNKGVIALLIVIIVILAVLCVLFATGTISFTSKSVENNNQESNNIINDDNTILTENDALTILKEKYNVAREVFDLGIISYCGKYATDDNSSKEIDGILFYKSTTYSNFEELSTYLKSYMTEELLNSTKNYNDSVSKSYYEENGNLYCSTRNKGGNVTYTSFLENESIFKINQITENDITATITAVYSDVDEKEKNSRTINVTLVKNSDNWLVNSYDDVTQY